MSAAVWCWICAGWRRIHAGLRDLAFWQAAAAIALVFVGVSQILVYCHQAEIMQRQLSVMQTDQRPWIQIEQARLDGVVLPANSDNINIQLSFALKNLGKTPALGIDVQVQAYVLTGKTFTQAAALQENSCAQSKVYPARKSSMSLMPGEPDTLHIGAVISMKQAIADADTDSAERAKYLPAEQAARAAPYKHDVVFTVSGCLDYFLSNDAQARGQTFFSYIVSGRGGYGIHLPFDGNLLPPQVGMTKNMWNNYAR